MSPAPSERRAKRGAKRVQLEAKVGWAVATDDVGICGWTFAHTTFASDDERTQESARRKYLMGHIGHRWTDMVNGTGARLVRVEIRELRPARAGERKAGKR